ncbi:MAG TPA: AMP-binding protein [Candidatus Dormibacteraeota bacterium]|nr:AMP-binding protein [Candidatus Dormibacteraeota bacterium]
MIEVLERAAREHGSALAVIADDGAVTYRELLDRIRPAGGRQHIALPNGARWLVAFWGAMAGGATVLPLNPRGKPDEVDYVKADFYAGDVDGEDDVRVVQYTAGTTGRPKGALLTGEGLMTVARGHAASWRLQPGDVVFIPNPMTHIMGLVLGVLMPAVSHATLLTMERFEPGAALELVERHRPVAMAGTPTHYHMLVEHPDLGSRDVSSLRFGLAGGAASTPEAVTRTMDRLGLEALLNGYGMSEACGSISRTELGDPAEAHALTAGRPMPWLETRLRDGQLEIRGRPVSRRYHRQATPAVDADGWFATGDLFDLDREGRLVFRGRAVDVVTVGGFNVYPAEVERVLAEHESVAQAQVVGVPDERLGCVPFAFVRLSPGAALDTKALAGHCAERLSGYKVPRGFRAVDAFPVNGAGKVEKYRLRELATR